MPEEKESFSFPEKLDPYTESITGLTQAEQNPIPPEIIEARIAQAKLAQEKRYQELSEQAAHQREQEKANANFQRIKEACLILVAVVAASIALGACWNIASDRNSSDDAKKAAIAAISSVLTSTMSGIGGYLAGKKST